MMALRKAMALAGLLLPSALAAQLTITVSPSSNVVQPGATLKFTATVPKSTSPWKAYWLTCSEPAIGCGYPRAYPSTVAELGPKQVLTFESYTVSSALKPGTMLCFGVNTTGWHLKPVVVASACRQVSAPDVAADDATKAATTVSATPAISARGSTSRTRSASSGGARSTATARSSAGGLPDLVITFEKGPVAQWIVRNIGTANAPATSVEFRRLGVSGSTSHAVGGLAPGASAVITVTPQLDVYLVNSTADVDPSATIVELDETNNRWVSATSR
ncbi:MAG TPA: CARDB domain-containing protein [Gemmatimonadaceae bacterium]|nr:CARDB domain-containing protein [Gemmatimonadaceae bacterium]